MKVTLELRGLEQVTKDLQREVDQFKSFVLDTFQRQVVGRTPIDTGRARKGWQKRQNSVENQVPYIDRLERGWSKQAPRGFVKQAITATVNETKRIIK